MRTTIFKYERGVTDNYFTGLTLVDKIILNRLPVNNFPIFKEEYNQEDDVNVLRTGYFDVTLSLLMSERSVQNVLVKDFFNVSYKFLIVCETGHVERTYSGIIDDMEFDYTVSNNSYNVQLSVYGIETEFLEKCKGTNIGIIPHDMNFENEYLAYHFQSVDLINIESALDIDSRIGEELIIDKTFQNDFITRTEGGFTCWDGFISFLLGYQFRFRLIFSHIDNDHAYYNLRLYWRSEGVNNAVVPSRNITYKKTYLTGGHKWCFIGYTRRTVTYAGRSAYQYTGFIRSSDTIHYSQGGADPTYIHYIPEYDFYYAGGDSMPGVQVLKINLPVYNINYAAGDIAYSRTAANAGLEAVWQYIANVETRHYMSGSKEIKKLKIKVDDDSNIILGSLGTIDGDPQLCERINSYDVSKKTMETEWSGV